MSAPVIPVLDASTINRKWVLEVNTGTTLAPVWTPCGGLKNFAPTTDDANLEDDGRFSDGGYSRMNKTGTGWNASATFSRAPLVSDGTAYDVGQEFLRSKGEGKLGSAAQVGVRFYEFDATAGTPRVQAYSGTAIVQWNEPGGERTGLAEATVTLTGQGALLAISHPYPNAAVVPAIYSVVPASGTTFAAAGGTGFRAVGNHFTGVTGASGVTFGGTNATSYVLWSDGEITGVAPAKTAGPVNVVITNVTGASPAFVVTYV